jgi:DNA modification methylase
MLTEEGEIVVDPFAGSNTTGATAEGLDRQWIAIENVQDYLEASKFRFDSVESATVERQDVRGAGSTVPS